MRVKSIVLCSASTLMLALGAAPSMAQTSPPPPAPGPNAAGAQTNPADSAPAAAPDAGSPDDSAIVVTGLRRSLQSARNLKRNSDQIVDAVVAEDIGKLPDITVSDTAARIPGVQVERAGGEANRVLLRGLDNTYYTTTYNSRELFTAETRSVALQDFPAGAIAAIEVFKTSTANLVEPGIAGLVNVRSRRPFDFAGSEISGSVWGLRPNQSRDNSVNANLLLSDRWQAGAGEFGALINFSYTRMHYKDSIRRHGFFIADLAGGRSPDYPEIHYNEGDRWRPSVNGALQYRNGNLELYAEGLWQGYRERQLDSMWAQPLWGGAGYSNLTFRPGTNQIVSGTVTGPGNCCGVDGEAWGFKGATHRETNTYQFAVGGSYDAGQLRITADLARTSSHFQLRTESLDYQIGTHNYSVDWYTGYPGSDRGPTFKVVGLNPADQSIYQYRGFFEDWHDPRGKDLQGRLDFEFDPHLSFIPKIQWGVRYVDRDTSDRGGSFYWNARGLGVPITAVPLTYALIPSAFRGDSNAPFPTSWYAPTYDSVWNNLTAFRQYNINLVGGGSVNGPPINSANTYTINEKSLAGYAQANFKFEAGSTTVDGIVGLRAVRSRDSLQGTLTELSGPVPVNVSNRYTDWLPNANLNIHLDRDWILRLAATKTRTRPRFQDLNPSPNLPAPITGCSVQTTCLRAGSAGNPNLKPFTSENYDASLEYYFSRTGYATIGAFHRDIKGFIESQSFSAPDPAAAGVTLQITRPVNTEKGKIDGFEAQIRTFFDFDFLPDWAHAFGIDANVTHVNARADFRPLGTFTVRLPIQDVSKWNYNLTGMYEHGPLSLRLSYSWRGAYPEGALANNGGYTLQGRAHPSPRLDFSATFNVNDKFSAFFDWTNIAGRPFSSDIVRTNYTGSSVASTEIFPMVVRYEERIMSLGIRFNFAGPKHEAPAR